MSVVSCIHSPKVETMIRQIFVGKILQEAFGENSFKKRGSVEAWKRISVEAWKCGSVEA